MFPVAGAPVQLPSHGMSRRLRSVILKLPSPDHYFNNHDPHTGPYLYIFLIFFVDQNAYFGIVIAKIVSFGSISVR